MARPRTLVADYKKLMLRLPADVLEACRQTAEEENRSMNAQILHMVEKCLYERRHTHRERRPKAREEKDDLALAR